MNNKYEISEIAHPKYPWLHRIRALSDVRPGVQKGDLPGSVAEASVYGRSYLAVLSTGLQCPSTGHPLQAGRRTSRTWPAPYRAGLFYCAR